MSIISLFAFVGWIRISVKACRLQSIAFIVFVLTSLSSNSCRQGERREVIDLGNGKIVKIWIRFRGGKGTGGGDERGGVSFFSVEFLCCRQGIFLWAVILLLLSSVIAPPHP